MEGISFVVKIGKDLKTLPHREESVGEMTDSGINSEANVLRREKSKEGI